MPTCRVSPEHALCRHQIQQRERLAERTGVRTGATTRGGGTSNSAIKAATALTIQRFMSSHLRPGSEPQINLAWNVMDYRGATATTVEIRLLNKKSPDLSEASAFESGFCFHTTVNC